MTVQPISLFFGNTTIYVFVSERATSRVIVRAITNSINNNEYCNVKAWVNTDGSIGYEELPWKHLKLKGIKS